MLANIRSVLGSQIPVEVEMVLQISTD